MDVSTQAIEYLHRPEFLKPFVQAGFNPYEPAWDTGIDFILVKESKIASTQDIVIKVQLKSRWTIKYKYFKRNIWIAFPEFPLEKANKTGKPRLWYLMPHDIMVAQAALDHGDSDSFCEGHYSKKSVTQDFRQKYHRFEVNNLLQHIELHGEVLSLATGLAPVWNVKTRHSAQTG